MSGADTQSLTSIKHPNVVGVVGVCMRRRPPMLLYELCDCTLDQYVEAVSPRPSGVDLGRRVWLTLALSVSARGLSQLPTFRLSFLSLLRFHAPPRLARERKVLGTRASTCSLARAAPDI